MTDYPKSSGRATDAGAALVALDAEAQALELVRGDRSLTPTPDQLSWRNDKRPSLDPEKRAETRCEAGLLLAAVFDPPTEPRSPPPATSSERGGYAVVGHRSSDDARVHPRLAEALAAQEPASGGGGQTEAASE